MKRIEIAEHIKKVEVGAGFLLLQEVEWEYQNNRVISSLNAG